MSEGRTTLIIPGWNGSGDGHWQSVWERKYRKFRRVEQRDWRRPHREDWTHSLTEAIASAESPVVLVAHSLGCLAVACCVETSPETARKIDCALLVAPPDLSQPTAPEPLRRFAPVPRNQLPFRSQLIGSENDPYMALSAAERLAADWGSHFLNAGSVGHINCASGFGDWPQGELYLERLMRREEHVPAPWV